MEQYAIAGVIAVAAIVVIIAGILIFKNRSNAPIAHRRSISPASKNTALQESAQLGSLIKFEDVQSLTCEEETQLLEIKDKRLLTKIDGAIPGTLQAVANSSTAKGAQEITKGGNLYRAIIPNGAVLDKSRAMDGAFRASFRNGPNGIKGNANLVPVDASLAERMAAASAANAAMNVASMVVGQYYMAQINNRLESIADTIDRIIDFQNNEYKSKVLALVAEMQRASMFQLETMENNELRNRELTHLKSIEHECAELLGQANISLQSFAGKTGIDYEHYEKLVGEAQPWLQCQQVLLQVMQQIADLSFALNLGAISRENSFSLLSPYKEQASAARANLMRWHEKTCRELKVDVDAAWRERKGMDKIVMAVPALFNDNLHYKAIPKHTARQIRTQMTGQTETATYSEDLFHEDVQFIAKNGALYYLPTSKRD